MKSRRSARNLDVKRSERLSVRDGYGICEKSHAAGLGTDTKIIKSRRRLKKASEYQNYHSSSEYNYRGRNRLKKIIKEKLKNREDKDTQVEHSVRGSQRSSRRGQFKENRRTKRHSYAGGGADPDWLLEKGIEERRNILQSLSKRLEEQNSLMGLRDYGYPQKEVSFKFKGTEKENSCRGKSRSSRGKRDSYRKSRKNVLLENYAKFIHNKKKMIIRDGGRVHVKESCRGNGRRCGSQYGRSKHQRLAAHRGKERYFRLERDDDGDDTEFKVLLKVDK